MTRGRPDAPVEPSKPSNPPRRPRKAERNPILEDLIWLQESRSRRLNLRP